MSPRKLYNYYLDAELAEGLKLLKARHGTPEAESVRRAIAMYLESQGVTPKKTERKRVAARKRP